MLAYDELFIWVDAETHEAETAAGGTNEIPLAVIAVIETDAVAE